MKAMIRTKLRLLSANVVKRQRPVQRPRLRLYDGFDHTSPELGAEVKSLQKALQLEGYNLEADGWFGRDTVVAVRDFQAVHGLGDDGVVGAPTWAVLLERQRTRQG